MSTFPPRPSKTRCLDAYVKLMRAAESVTSRIHVDLPKGVTIGQFGVLEALLHCGPLFQSELAGKVLKSPGNLTLVVDNLERDGHVRRERDPADRRYVKVDLTPQGRAFVETLFPKIAANVAREFSTLTDDEQSTLAALCKKVGRGRPATTTTA